MPAKPWMTKAHSHQVAEELVRLGWTLKTEFRAEGDPVPYEYLLVWEHSGDPPLNSRSARVGDQEPMEFKDVTFIGPPIDDPDLLGDLPIPLADVLAKTNGLIAFRGGLHIRGVCLAPAWHSLRRAWRGPESFAARYSTVRAEDVPFAQDALGDQYLLRDDMILRLRGETGEVEALSIKLGSFLNAACSDPVGYLVLAPLLAFEEEGGRLEPGKLLNVVPPFCLKAD